MLICLKLSTGHYVDQSQEEISPLRSAFFHIQKKLMIPYPKRKLYEYKVSKMARHNLGDHSR